MKIYSGDTWTLEELQEQVADAGRRSLVVPPADSKRAVLETFGEVLATTEQDTLDPDALDPAALDIDALNDALHDLADSITDNGNPPVTILWQVAGPFRSDRSFGVICEVLQDAERYAGRDLAVTAILL